MKKTVLTIVLSMATAIGVASTSTAFTTNAGQTWDTEPDAWSRGNTADTSWFGWDEFEPTGPPTAPFFSFILDDSTPDIGSPTTATSTNIAQSVASQAVYGHRSSSANYYSGFPDDAFADDTISGVAPASGAGGYTTILLQVIGLPGNRVSSLSFDPGAEWTRTSDVEGRLADTAGLYWQEWTAPGGNLPFSIEMTSSESSIALDAIQIDTFWTSGDAPVLNSRDRIGIPEPASLLLMAVFFAVPMPRSR